MRHHCHCHQHPWAAPGPLFVSLRYWKSLKNLLASLINSIEAIFSLLVLLFLFLGIFALLGTQVFGAKFKQRINEHASIDHTDYVPRTPRANFDSFENSFYTVFQVRYSQGYVDVPVAVVRLDHQGSQRTLLYT